MANNIAAAINIVRPNDTSIYAGGDVIGVSTASGGAVLTIGPAGLLPYGGEVFITTARFEIDLSAVISGMTSFRLHLYNVTPPSAYGDNTAWDLPAGDRDAYKGYIDLGTPVDVGSTLYVETTQINKQTNIPAGLPIFGYLVTVGGYTPSALDAFRIRLHGVGV